VAEAALQVAVRRRRYLRSLLLTRYRCFRKLRQDTCREEVPELRAGVMVPGLHVALGVPLMAGEPMLTPMLQNSLCLGALGKMRLGLL
jgi:hypothetical protein